MVLYWRGSSLSSPTEPSVSVPVVVCLQRSIFGVPRGSVLGPLPSCFCSTRTAELFDIIASLGLIGHSQRMIHKYISAPVVESQQAATRLAECIELLDRWMGQNDLKLNAEKGQLLWLGSRHQ